MMRYYLDIRDGDWLIRDHTGEEVSPGKIRSVAIRSLLEVGGALLKCNIHRNLAIEVRDDEDPVMRVYLDFDIDEPVAETQ